MYLPENPSAQLWFGGFKWLQPIEATDKIFVMQASTLQRQIHIGAQHTSLQLITAVFKI